MLREIPRVVRLVRAPVPQDLVLPVEGVRPEELVDTWGAARGDGRRHEGIDIFAPRETQVLAATGGLVVRRGWNELGGRRVAVLGPGGQYHYYAHLEEYGDPKPGNWVEAGTVLGYVGDSGNAQGTPTHLHYGIYEITGAVNPYPRLAFTPRPLAGEGPGVRARQAPSPSP